MAAGRMRGGAACADARNPSPQPSPLLRGRERESAGGVGSPGARTPARVSFTHDSARPSSRRDAGNL